jgi:signal recognition particle subunit SRP68
MRQQHGLRRRDFEMYHQYTVKKLRRLRLALNMTQQKDKIFRKHTMTAKELQEPRHLCLLLMEAERAWAYAMSLKQHMERKREELRAHDIRVRPRVYYHLVKRLRRAVRHAETVMTLCQQVPCTIRTQLHTQAYADYLKGQLAFEEGRWESALNFLSMAKNVYEKLAMTTSETERYYEEHLSELNEFIRVTTFQLRSVTGKRPEEVKAFIDGLNRATATDSVTLDFLSANMEVKRIIYI